MMKIEFKDNKTESFSGTSKKTNKPFSITKQVGWLHGTEAYPVKVEIMLKDEQKPYSRGFYRVDADSSIYVDRNNRLAISPVLIEQSEKVTA